MTGTEGDGPESGVWVEVVEDAYEAEHGWEELSEEDKERIEREVQRRLAEERTRDP